MSVQNVIENIVINIKENIADRDDAIEILEAIELITRMPNEFKKLIDAASFFVTHHDIHDGCPNGVEGGCDECYSGDTEFEYIDELGSTAKSLFKHLRKENDESDDEEDGENESDGENEYDDENGLEDNTKLNLSDLPDLLNLSGQEKLPENHLREKNNVYVFVDLDAVEAPFAATTMEAALREWLNKCQDEDDIKDNMGVDNLDLGDENTQDSLIEIMRDDRSYLFTVPVIN